MTTLKTLEEKHLNQEEAQLIKDLLELVICTIEGYLDGAYGFALGLEKVYEEIEEGTTLEKSPTVFVERFITINNTKIRYLCTLIEGE